MMKQFVVIKADNNDADYVYSSNIIGLKESKKLKEILDKMPKNSSGEIPYETQEIGNDDKSSNYSYITQKEKDFLGSYLPFGDPNYGGIHTICEVQIMQELIKIV